MRGRDRRASARAALALLLALLSGALAPAAAQVPDSPPSSPSPSVAAEAWIATVPVAGEALLLGRVGAYAATAPLRWGRGELQALGVSLLGIAALSLLDEEGRELMARNRSEVGDRLEDAIEPFGRERGLQLLGALYATGLLLGDERMRGVAAEGAASGVVAAALVQPAVALATGRPRPRADRPAHTFEPFSGNISFPSGHTTAAFSVASVIAAEYEHPAVGVAAYGLATAVGVARMYRGAHFVSDVAAAALLGTAVGRSVARFGDEYRHRLRMEPVVAGGRTYLVLRLAI